MLQKKKSQQSITRKLNRIKSEEHIPLGSLMMEIGQLKEELKCIKKTRKNQQSSVTVKGKRKDQNKENSLEKQFSSANFNLLKRQHRLKIEIVWGKLLKGLENVQTEKVKYQIRQLVELFIASLADFTYEENQLKKQIKECQKLRQQENEEQSSKYWHLSEEYRLLQKEVEEAKVEKIAMMKEKQEKEEYMFEDFDKQKEIIHELKTQLEGLTRNNFQLESMMEEWQLQCKNLQERCLMFEKKVISKEQQIQVMHEDVKYLRLESEKYKSQKKQFQKLWETAQIDLKQFKIAFEEEVVKAEREKVKWMNQCSLRRQQSEQIQAIETQKQLMAKEIHEMRNNYSLKCKELAETKSLLHELQRRIIEVDSDNFRMVNEVQKLQREKQYWETEMINLRKEFQEYYEVSERRPKEKEKAKSKQKKGKEEKMQAFDDIQSLIKKCRKND